MQPTADSRPGAAQAASRPLTWVLSSAVTGVCVLVAFASMGGGLATSTVTMTAWISWDGSFLVLALVQATAFVAGLLMRRRWTWPLLGSAALTAMAVLPYLLPWLALPARFVYLLPAVVPLAVTAMLGAAQELLDSGAVGAAAGMAGSTVGASLIGGVTGAGWLRQEPWLPMAYVVLAVVGLASAVLTAVVRRSRPLPRVSGEPAAAQATPFGAHAARPALTPALVTGVLAALLAFVPVVVTGETLSAVLGVSLEALGRRSYVLVGAIGLVTLACAAALAALNGVRAFTGAAVAALAQVGAITSMTLAVHAAAFQSAAGPVAALLGFAVGCAVAVTRLRIPLAAAGCVAVVLVLLLAVAATGGEPEKLAAQGTWIPGALLLASLVAVATAATASAAPLTARRGGMAAVLGPITAALVTGGRQVLPLAEPRGGELESSSLGGVHHMVVSVGLFLLTALVVAGIGVADMLRARSAPR
ncbi:hypothetical protein [Streptosporangium carneum]|uniref:MFS transporter n=1 Tax=Streptosporangium carneum TaxID=47481 RepID=A0A9W6MG69_9ACTN|nr:hypothetical protein [Streptosporangium carneum]GLK13419.1 hypothetical protein GCM10017600_68300 [Streptosporangium carneum]